MDKGISTEAAPAFPCIEQTDGKDIQAFLQIDKGTQQVISYRLLSVIIRSKVFVLYKRWIVERTFSCLIITGGSAGIMNLRSIRQRRWSKLHHKIIIE